MGYERTERDNALSRVKGEAEVASECPKCKAMRERTRGTKGHKCGKGARGTRRSQKAKGYGVPELKCKWKQRRSREVSIVRWGEEGRTIAQEQRQQCAGVGRCKDVSGPEGGERVQGLEVNRENKVTRSRYGRKNAAGTSMHSQGEQVGTKCKAVRTCNCEVRQVPVASGGTSGVIKAVEEAPTASEPCVHAGGEDATEYRTTNKEARVRSVGEESRQQQVTEVAGGDWMRVVLGVEEKVCPTRGCSYGSDVRVRSRTAKGREGETKCNRSGRNRGSDEASQGRKSIGGRGNVRSGEERERDVTDGK